MYLYMNHKTAALLQIKSEENGMTNKAEKEVNRTTLQTSNLDHHRL